MASSGSSLTRSSSADSSTLSHITVVPSASQTLAGHDTPKQSSDVAATGLDSPAESESQQRPKRKRNVSSYNLKELAQAQHPASPKAQVTRDRNASGLTGKTLVASENGSDDDEVRGSSNSTTPKRKRPRGLGLDDTDPIPSNSGSRIIRKPSIREKVKNTTKKLASVLGKRSREAVEAGKKTFGMTRPDRKQKSKLLRELDMGKGGILDEMDLNAEYPAPPPSRAVKRIKLEETAEDPQTKLLVTGPLQKTSAGRRVKKWQTHGLYVGQEFSEQRDRVHHPRKLVKSRPSSAAAMEPEHTSENVALEESAQTKVRPVKQQSFMPLPMFNRLDADRDFIIPYDVFAPAATKDDKPKDWRQLNKNRLIGEAKDLWEREDRLPASVCVCPAPAAGELGCEEDCLNRVMQYECNEDNCALPPEMCSNRAFSELAARTKKAGRFDVGVEVIKTAQRGHGVRACRSFLPGQIIMEYTGEIISEAECQRRMHEDYKDSKCYYLMELERNLVIDGTKGSMARFINHSCEPNCEVRMLKVNGIPRMGVFAGASGIATGEELTYDYNFDNFGETQQACYCGTAACRGTLSKRLNAAEQKKQAKEDSERKRKAAMEAQRHAEAEERKKKIKTERGSNWRGWVALDDAEVREKLRQEKKAREEAEKSSARSQRAAARQQVPSTVKTNRQQMPKAKHRRRSAPAMTATASPATRKVDKDQIKLADKAEAVKSLPPASSRPTRHVRTTSTGSKFTEELSLPSGAPPSSSRHKTVYKSTTITSITSTVTKDITDLGSDPSTSADSDEVELWTSHTNRHIDQLAEELENSVPKAKRDTASVFASMSKKLKQTTLRFPKVL